jgi:predicted phage replisome organizer
MKERKYVKLRVDMYEDTKFKIIDMKPERDVIHYIWNRLVLLSGKVNLEGELFLSENMPYTIETLAIEFNRDPSQIKLALELFIELQMLELTEAKVYTVKNFAKHQNIKRREKEVAKNNEVEVNNINDSLNGEVQKKVVDKKAEDGVNSEKATPILFDVQKSRKRTKKKKDNKIDIDITTEESIVEEINSFTEEESPLAKDETILLEWSFG